MSQTESLERKPDETLEKWVARIKPLYKGEISLEGDVLTMRPWQPISLPLDKQYVELMQRRSADAQSNDSEEDYYSEADW
jgi:hypothetical protein